MLRRRPCTRDGRVVHLSLADHAAKRLEIIAAQQEKLDHFVFGDLVAVQERVSSPAGLALRHRLQRANLEDQNSPARNPTILRMREVFFVSFEPDVLMIRSGVSRFVSAELMKMNQEGGSTGSSERSRPRLPANSRTKKLTETMKRRALKVRKPEQRPPLSF
ncbi:hypothetical protein [Bradyrhizobium sp. Arg816]|uniref:hypothetical protein n=1 Tax=Bradyrhizobium sp. Arg816 TaxID=2998491 RepID=UPI00249EADD8|nr:hypothetical protein [Bradyrhizobium sp. Arg816]MDI3567390.1 hypothetical protein [Bradyrhizobium sp. Arg816]